MKMSLGLTEQSKGPGNQIMSNNNPWTRDHKLQLWHVIVALLAAIVAVIVPVLLALTARSDDAEGSPSGDPTPSASTGSPASTTTTDSATPTASESATPADQFSQIYSGKRLRITSPPHDWVGNLYMTAVDLDLDHPKTVKVLETEWQDGSAAGLGYDLAFEWHGWLFSSTPWKRNSKAAAPKDPEACLEAARTSEDPSDLSAQELEPGAVLCIETSEGKVALARMLNYVENPTSVTFDVALWAP